MNLNLKRPIDSVWIAHTKKTNTKNNLLCHARRIITSDSFTTVRSARGLWVAANMSFLKRTTDDGVVDYLYELTEGGPMGPAFGDVGFRFVTSNYVGHWVNWGYRPCRLTGDSPSILRAYDSNRDRTHWEEILFELSDDAAPAPLSLSALVFPRRSRLLATAPWRCAIHFVDALPRNGAGSAEDDVEVVEGEDDDADEDEDGVGRDDDDSGVRFDDDDDLDGEGDGSAGSEVVDGRCGRDDDPARDDGQGACGDDSRGDDGWDRRAGDRSCDGSGRRSRRFAPYDATAVSDRDLYTSASNPFSRRREPFASRNDVPFSATNYALPSRRNVAVAAAAAAAAAVRTAPPVAVVFPRRGLERVRDRVPARAGVDAGVGVAARACGAGEPPRVVHAEFVLPPVGVSVEDVAAVRSDRSLPPPGQSFVFSIHLLSECRVNVSVPGWLADPRLRPILSRLSTANVCIHLERGLLRDYYILLRDLPMSEEVRRTCVTVADRDHFVSFASLQGVSDPVHTVLYNQFKEANQKEFWKAGSGWVPLTRDSGVFFLRKALPPAALGRALVLAQRHVPVRHPLFEV